MVSSRARLFFVRELAQQVGILLRSWPTLRRTADFAILKDGSGLQDHGERLTML